MVPTADWFGYSKHCYPEPRKGKISTNLFITHPITDHLKNNQYIICSESMGEYTVQWMNTIPRQFDSAAMSGLHVMSFGPVSHYGYRTKIKAQAICESYKK